MILKLIRSILGNLIIVIDAVIPVKKTRRTELVQKQMLQDVKHLSLYQFKLCPFCVRVRRHMRSLGLPIAIKDAKNDPKAREALKAGGGKVKVPCLRIEDNGQVTWLYESLDIIAYLDKRFAVS